MRQIGLTSANEEEKERCRMVAQVQQNIIIAKNITRTWERHFKPREEVEHCFRAVKLNLTLFCQKYILGENVTLGSLKESKRY